MCTLSSHPASPALPLPSLLPSPPSHHPVLFIDRSLFPDRDCVALVRPMNDELQLANLDSVPREQLRPEFVEASVHNSSLRVYQAQ